MSILRSVELFLKTMNIFLKLGLCPGYMSTSHSFPLAVTCKCKGQMSVTCYRRWFRQKKGLLCNCCDFNPLVVIIKGKETAYTVLFHIKPIFSTLLRKFNFFDDIENNLLKTVRYFHWLSNCCGLHWCPVVSSTC